LIGRVLSTAFLVTAFAVSPAAANGPMTGAPVSTAVTWHKDGAISWQRLERRAFRSTTQIRLSVALEPGSSKVISRGEPGLEEVLVQYSQRAGGRVRQRILASNVIRAARPRIVAEGISPSTLAAFEGHGLAQMASIARESIQMMATAYTAASAGGSGRTAIGRRAGYGIVAVDPRVIPLGTRLYISGYGMAIAGDTGGDIVGNRIDLGFDSLRGAMLFGRRGVTVYRLK
jgi:3D (Asp-Asp-Asp) domain-containing protein